MNDDFFIQKIEIKQRGDRIPWFYELCNDKRVLHIGCVDSPIFNPNNNLHLQLSKITKEIVGLDIDQAGINELKKYFNGKYYSEIDQIINNNEKFDLILMPETIEHLDNPGNFIKKLMDINFDKILITAPNCFMTEPMKIWNNSEYYKNGEKTYFKELIHPDHNFWFSPWTLKNIVEKNCLNRLEFIETGTICDTFMVYIFAEKII